MAGVLLMASNFTSSILQPLFGHFSDKKEKAWLLPVGCLAAGVGLSLASVPHSFWPLFAPGGGERPGDRRLSPRGLQNRLLLHRRTRGHRHVGVRGGGQPGHCPGAIILPGGDHLPAALRSAGHAGLFPGVSGLAAFKWGYLRQVPAGVRQDQGTGSRRALRGLYGPGYGDCHRGDAGLDPAWGS